MAETDLLDALRRELHVWIADPGKLLPEQAAERYLPLLSSDEKERYARFHFDVDRMHYLAAHAMLRLVLSRYAPCKPEHWRFVRGSHGKPEIAANAELPLLRFNLTHTHGVVACIVALDTDCGIDAESIRSMRSMRGVAQTVFAEEEIAWLDAQAEAQRPDGFFALWTLKEAYIKAIGLGFSAPVKQISFDMNGEKPRLRVSADAESDTASWQFDLHRPTAAHRLAIAAQVQAKRPVVYRELAWL